MGVLGLRRIFSAKASLVATALARNPRTQGLIDLSVKTALPMRASSSVRLFSAAARTFSSGSKVRTYCAVTRSLGAIGAIPRAVIRRRGGGALSPACRSTAASIWSTGMGQVPGASLIDRGEVYYSSSSTATKPDSFTILSWMGGGTGSMCENSITNDPRPWVIDRSAAS